MPVLSVIRELTGTNLCRKEGILPASISCTASESLAGQFQAATVLKKPVPVILCAGTGGMDRRNILLLLHAASRTMRYGSMKFFLLTYIFFINPLAKISKVLFLFKLSGRKKRQDKPVPCYLFGMIDETGRVLFQDDLYSSVQRCMADE